MADAVVPNAGPAYMVVAVPGTSPVQIKKVAIVAWSVVDEVAHPVTVERIKGTEICGVHDPGLGTVEAGLQSFATLLDFRTWAGDQFAAQRSRRADHGY